MLFSLLTFAFSLIRNDGFSMCLSSVVVIIVTVTKGYNLITVAGVSCFTFSLQVAMGRACSWWGSVIQGFVILLNVKYISKCPISILFSLSRYLSLLNSQRQCIEVLGWSARHGHSMMQENDHTVDEEDQLFSCCGKPVLGMSLVLCPWLYHWTHPTFISDPCPISFFIMAHLAKVPLYILAVISEYTASSGGAPLSVG